MPGKHQHFQDPEVGCCGKYFLFGFNIVFWVSAGSASCPALGRGVREAASVSAGETLLRGCSPAPSIPIPSPQELSWGEPAGIPGGRDPGPAEGVWEFRVAAPSLGEKGAALAGRLQGRGGCGMSPAPPPGHSSSRPAWCVRFLRLGPSPSLPHGGEACEPGGQEVSKSQGLWGCREKELG